MPSPSSNTGKTNLKLVFNTRENRLRAFDSLPTTIRAFLRECPINFCPVQARDLFIKHGTATTLYSLEVTASKHQPFVPADFQQRQQGSSAAVPHEPTESA